MIGRTVSIEELVAYLVGGIDPRDIGYLGRLSKRVDRVEKLLWSILTTLFAALVALVANLIAVHGGSPIH